jgi:branched-chain amino acid transport system permease protein
VRKARLMIEEIIIYGTISSCMYALLALGFTLIYGVSGIINLAHGAFFMLGAYIFSILFDAFSFFVPVEFSYLVPILALVIAPILSGIIASIFYRVMLHQIVGDQLAIMIVSIGGSIIFQQMIYLILGPTSATTLHVPHIALGTIRLWNIQITNDMVLGAVVSLVLFLSLWLFISKTKIGKAMKALSQDVEAAMLMGISKERMYMLTAAISAGLAGIAGAVISASKGNVSAFSWLEPLAISFAIVILGGLGSIKGTLIGGFIFGYAYFTVTFMIPEGGTLVSSVPLIILIIVLILRPKGLFGKRIEMED